MRLLLALVTIGLFLPRAVDAGDEGPGTVPPTVKVIVKLDWQRLRSCALVTDLIARQPDGYNLAMAMVVGAAAIHPDQIETVWILHQDGKSDVAVIHGTFDKLQIETRARDNASIEMLEKPVPLAYKFRDMLSGQQKCVAWLNPQTLVLGSETALDGYLAVQQEGAQGHDRAPERVARVAAATAIAAATMVESPQELLRRVPLLAASVQDLFVTLDLTDRLTLFCELTAHSPEQAQAMREMSDALVALARNSSPDGLRSGAARQLIFQRQVLTEMLESTVQDNVLQLNLSIAIDQIRQYFPKWAR